MISTGCERIQAVLSRFNVRMVLSVSLSVLRRCMGLLALALGLLMGLIMDNVY